MISRRSITRVREEDDEEEEDELECERWRDLWDLRDLLDLAVRAGETSRTVIISLCTSMIFSGFSDGEDPRRDRDRLL